MNTNECIDRLIPYLPNENDEFGKHEGIDCYQIAKEINLTDATQTEERLFSLLLGACKLVNKLLNRLSADDEEDE